MATFKGQLETKTGTNTSDVLYPKTSVDQVDGLPTPTSSDNGKVLGVSSGSYALVSSGGGGGSAYPTVTISQSQIVSQDPLQIQLTNDQYNVFESNQLVEIDLSALGVNTVLWQYGNQDSSILWFYYFYGLERHAIDIDKDSYIATYTEGNTLIDVSQITTSSSSNYGKLVGLNSSGRGVATNSIPYITTAPTDNNTDGLKFVVLSAEPATYYTGYYYIITGA